MRPADTDLLLSEGLLGGRVRHVQPQDGHRSGIEPVLLAAAIPARPGERVLEGGTGSGAALLCLAARVAGIIGVGIERDPTRAAMAAANFAANGMAIEAVAADLTVHPLPGPFDHAMANPPWHPPGTASPDPAREAARRASAGILGAWAKALAAGLRHRGTLSLIIPAASLPEGLAALAAAGCGSTATLPLWPRAGVAAKLVILQAIRGGRGPARLLPGLVLHQGGEHGAASFTAEAEAVLRHAAPLPL